MFSAALINEPFEDPGAYVQFKYRNEAFLFDLGDLSRLTPRQILKIRHIFVSHTHMDHFIGFDHMLRIMLGRNQHISLFGPAGFLAKVESKLQSYTWNLVENYTNDFQIEATEIHETRRITRRYRCRNAFRPEGEERRETSDPILLDGNFFTVRGDILDHGIPCLAFRFEEKTRLNIKKNVLKEMGLPTGPWLNTLKEQIMQGEPGDTPVRIWWKNENGVTIEEALPLDFLKAKAVKVTEGQKICYVTDVRWCDNNVEKIITLARNAEILFIEAAFLREDMDTAARKNHLTAHQAGVLASMAAAKRLSIFHFSPKYKGMGEALEREAQSAFKDEGGS